MLVYYYVDHNADRLCFSFLFLQEIVKECNLYLCYRSIEVEGHWESLRLAVFIVGE